MTVSALDLHRQLLSIRRGEELIAEIYKTQVLRCPTHLAIGEEAIPVGVCAALDLTKDVCFAPHRSHGVYLACGGSYEALVAELYGSSEGCSRGRGGSVHLTTGKTGLIASSAILGQSIAVAAGAAWSFKMDGSKRVAVAFFGEAACEEGIWAETMNFASLHKLPLVMVCANNSYSTESPLSARQAEGTELCDRAVTFRVGAFKGDGNDVHEVYKLAKQAVAHARSGQPIFLELSTYRHREHVGPQFDHEVPGRTYRSKAELDTWLEFDPLIQSAAACDEREEELAALDAEIQAALRSAAERARLAPKPDKSTLFEGVW